MMPTECLHKCVNIRQGTEAKPDEYMQIEVAEKGPHVGERVIIVNNE